MNKKQTSIDWLHNTIISMVEHGADFGDDYPALLQHFKRAKELEKEQIESAYNDGYCDDGFLGDSYKSAEHYYKEIYE